MSAMHCPFCEHPDTQVKDSRPSDDGVAIRRRRFCQGCGARFTTFERIHLRELVVRKADGSRQAFDRDKLMRSLQSAISKRPVESERLERIVNAIQRELESAGEPEVGSQQVAERAMDALGTLDPVAFVRYVSVYRDFKDPKDFSDFIEQIKSVGGRAG